MCPLPPLPCAPPPTTQAFMNTDDYLHNTDHDFDNQLYIYAKGIHEMFIFIDVGYDPQGHLSTWSVVIIALLLNGQSSIIRSIGGIIPFNSNHPNFLLEEDNSDSFGPELYANAIALILLVQYGQTLTAT